MRSWRVVLVLVAILGAPGVFQALAQDSDREMPLDADGVEIWTDARASDAPLQSASVVHRDGSDALVANENFEKTWIVIVDGAKHESGTCGFSLEFSEPADTATPKVFLMTAVDPKTCQAEFTVGIPSDPKIPAVSDMAYDLDEPKPSKKGDKRAGAAPLGSLAYLSPEAAARLGADPLYYPLPQIRYTVIAEWMDPPQKIVNRVLSAVKARVDNDNRQSHARCKNQRAWLESDQLPSHWQNMSTGRWGDEECNKSRYNTKSVTSARFKNEDFPPVTS